MGSSYIRGERLVRLTLPSPTPHHHHLSYATFPSPVATLHFFTPLGKIFKATILDLYFVCCFERAHPVWKVTAMNPFYHFLLKLGRGILVYNQNIVGIAQNALRGYGANTTYLNWCLSFPEHGKMSKQPLFLMFSETSALFVMVAAQLLPVSP